MATIDWLDKLFQEAGLISYDPTASGLAAVNVQDAIDELAEGAASQTYAEVTDTSLSGTYNALAIAGFNDASSAVLAAVNMGTATINGILAPPVEVNGLQKLVRLPYGTFTTTLVHNSGSAAAGDKIITATGGYINNQGPGNSDVYVLLTRAGGNWFATRLGTRALSFGVSTRNLSATAPTAFQVLTSDGSDINGVSPGTIMARMTASNSSTAALVFSSNQRLIWNGSTTPSFTANLSGAADGATVTIFFPASLGLTTFTLSSDLDPTGTVAYAFDSGSAAYRLTAQYLADGPSIVCSLRKVTDL
jgi:hypothetical protein